MRTTAKRKKRPPGLDIDPAGLETLARVLAVVDASFAPIRTIDYRSTLSAAASQSRAAYPTVGVAWYGGSGKAATDRKTHERAIGELRDAKFLTNVKPSSRSTRVKLTDLGEAVARAAAGLPGLVAGRLTVETLIEQGDAKRALAKDWKRGDPIEKGLPPGMEQLVPETVLAGVRWGNGNGKLFIIAEEMALPALVRGWVGWRVDSLKHVCYEVLPAGRQAYEDGIDDGPGDDLVPESAECREAYYAEFASARSRLESVSLDPPGEIGEIPLSNSYLGWLDVAYADMVAAIP